MVTSANITPTFETDGLVYSNAVPITNNEADLNGGVGAITGTIPVVYGQIILAVVQLNLNGLVVGNNTYVVMQTDLGDGVWIDVAWPTPWTGTQGSIVQVLAGGGMGQQNNAFTQTRQSGQPPTPQAAGSNAVPLGGRVRFVGKSLFVGGSSSISGTPTAVSATIKFKLMTPR